MKTSKVSGALMHQWATELFPINRSLTGDGVRETINYLQGLMPSLTTHSIPSGSQVCDWQVPKEWSVNEAYIITPSGKKICNYADNNLHLVGYSTPINKTLSLEELTPHLYTLPDQPDAIPYITSYYQERWGFCLNHQEFESLEQGEYQVVIDSALFNGQLNYADTVIHGKCDKEILISTYLCHPSMANNELSGPVVVTALAQWLLANQASLKYSYRLVFVPETIGSICYIDKHIKHLREKVVAGFQVSCVGDDLCYSHVASRYGNNLSDRVVQEYFKEISQQQAKVTKTYSYLARGSDERQYDSPFVELPICGICRSKYAEFEEYHTSKDNLDFISANGLAGGLDILTSCISKLEQAQFPIIKTFGEPQLGKRGLYPTFSQQGSYHVNIENMMNCIAYADGTNRMEDIAKIIGVNVKTVQKIVEKLTTGQLMTILDTPLSLAEKQIE